MSNIHTQSLVPNAARQLAAFDPRSQLRAFIQSPRESGATAEEALLSWLVSLPSDVDPARAAKCLGELPPFVAQGDGGGGAHGDGEDEAARLTSLLREVAAWPKDRLPTGRRSGRRSMV